MAQSRYVPAERPRRSMDNTRTSLDDRHKPKHVHFGAVVEYPISPEQPRPSGERTRRTPRRDPSPPPSVRPPPTSRQPSKSSSLHRSGSSRTAPYPDDDYYRRMRSQHDDYTARRQSSQNSSNVQHLPRSTSDRRSGNTTSRSTRPRSNDLSTVTTRKPHSPPVRYSYPPASSPTYYSSRSSHGGASRHWDEARHAPRTVSAR